MPNKYYYAVVDKRTGKVVGRNSFSRIQIHRKKEDAYKLFFDEDETVVRIPISALNAFIQQYIPYPPVDQIPGN